MPVCGRAVRRSPGEPGIAQPPLASPSVRRGGESKVVGGGRTFEESTRPPVSLTRRDSSPRALSRSGPGRPNRRARSAGQRAAKPHRGSPRIASASPWSYARRSWATRNSTIGRDVRERFTITSSVRTCWREVVAIRPRRARARTAGTGPEYARTPGYRARYNGLVELRHPIAYRRTSGGDRDDLMS